MGDPSLRSGWHGNQVVMRAEVAICISIVVYISDSPANRHFCPLLCPRMNCHPERSEGSPSHIYWGYKEGRPYEGSPSHIYWGYKEDTPFEGSSSHIYWGFKGCTPFQAYIQFCTSICRKEPWYWWKYQLNEIDSFSTNSFIFLFNFSLIEIMKRIWNFI